MKGFLVDIEFMWGFQSRVVGMSKSSPSFALPPPTTVLGAIAEAYARRKGQGEGDAPGTLRNLAGNLLALAYKPLNAIPLTYQDLNRIIAIRVSGGISYPSPLDPYGSFDAPARGKTILSTVDGRPPALRVFAVFKDAADVTAEDLWKIKRVGSKESMVSVVDVVEREPEVLKGVEVETDYLLPLTPEIEGSLGSRSGLLELEFVSVYDLRSGEPAAELYLKGKTLRHVVGLPLLRDRKVRVKLPAGYAGYKIGEEVAVGIEG